MVIRKVQEMAPSVQGPGLRTELAHQGVNQLEEIHAVEGGIKALIAFIVGHGVAHVIAHDLVVIAADHFPDKDKILLPGRGFPAKSPQEIPVHQIGHIQTQAVDAEGIDPHLHAVQQIIADRRIPKIQLHQVVVAFPAFIPETVVVAVISPEVDIKPVFIRRAFPVLQHILKAEEAPAHVVEYAVQKDPDAGFMEGIADLLKVFIGAKTHIYLLIIPCIIAVGVGLKDGREVYRAHMKLLQVRNPVHYLPDPGREDAVVLEGCAGKAHGIYLIKYGFIRPHKTTPLLGYIGSHRTFAGALTPHQVYPIIP